MQIQIPSLDFIRAYKWLLINLRPECPEHFLLPWGAELEPRGERVVEPQVRKEWAGVIHLPAGGIWLLAKTSPV